MLSLCIYVCMQLSINRVLDFHQLQLYAFEFLLQVPLGNFAFDWLMFTVDTFFSRALRDNQQVLVLI